MAELKTFLFTDICRSVDLKNEMVGRSVTERDLAFIESILTPHRQRIEAELEANGGRVVSTAGDGHFLVFTNTIQAAQWAVDVQESHRDQPIITPSIGKLRSGRVEVRISIHVGVPQVDPADPSNFVGKTVDYASRLNDYASGGQILVSRSVMAILDDVGLEGIELHLHGRRQLKGIGRVEVHELIYEETGPRTMRRQPASHHSDRQWTVIPATVLYESGDPMAGSSGDPSGTAVGSGSGRSIGGSIGTDEQPMLKRVGNYELEELIGSGGMGDVYKARHIQFGRVRAVKVIKHQYVAAGHQEVIRRFYHEIKAIGALEHKHIVVAIDSSSPEDRIHYLVMEYINGVSLHELIDQRGSLSSADACEIIRQAALGLQYIHRNQMVHRDLKPSNLMLTLVDGDDDEGNHPLSDSSFDDQPCRNAAHGASAARGIVKILDLGLALLVADQEDRLTRFENKAMGTDMYMSPEQWKTTSVDIRADIYSLGCTLYHLLSGNPPFYDSDLRPEKAHEKSNIPPIRNGSQIPRKLWDVIRKMLAKNPADRYQTPAEVSAALAPLTDGHNLARLVREFCEADSELAIEIGTRPESATQVDTSSKVADALSSVLLTRPSRRTAMWTGAIAVAGGMSAIGYWQWRGLSPARTIVRDEVAAIPGLNGEWWFHEIPWFTPTIRQAWINAVDRGERQFGSTSLDQLGLLHRSDEVPQLYHKLQQITAELQQRLSRPQQQIQRVLEKAMQSLGSPDIAPYEKGLNEALEKLALLQTKTAVDMHLTAVLHHALAQWTEAEEAYIAAVASYESDRLDPARPLVMLDYARMQLDSKKYDQAIQSFSEIRSLSTSPMLKMLTLCLEAEADYRSSSDAQLKRPLNLMTIAARDDTLGEHHPLRAFLFERQGWILNEAWRFSEAVESFAMSKHIVDWQMSFTPYPNQHIPMLELWARQGEATAINFRDGAEAARPVYQKLANEIESTLGYTGDAPEKFHDLTPQQRQKFMERLPSIYLRLGDCFLLAEQPDYTTAAEWYRRCITESEDLHWEQTDRRANYVIDWRYKRCLPVILSGFDNENRADAKKLFDEASEHEKIYIERHKDSNELPSTSFQFSKDMVRGLMNMADESPEVRTGGIEALFSQVKHTEIAKLGRHRLGTFVLAIEQLAQSDLKKDPKRLRELASHVNDVFVVFRKTAELQPYLQRSMRALLLALKKSYEETQDNEIQRQLNNIDALILK